MHAAPQLVRAALTPPPPPPEKNLISVEDAGLMKCGMHNAKLDCATMTYKSGPTFLKGMGKKVEEGTAHPQFAVALNADGSATLTPPAGFKAGGGCNVM